MNPLHTQKNPFLLITIFIVILFVSHLMQAYQKPLTTTPNNIASPRKNHPILYVINAKYGIIKKHNQSYDLTLNYVDPLVNYKNDYTKKSGSYSLREFFEKWIANGKEEIEADITGVQVDNKTIGHAQLYAVVMLSHPLYFPLKKQVTFRLKPLTPQLNMDRFARFDNATVFIGGDASFKNSEH